MEKILIIEDENEIAELEKDYLELDPEEGADTLLAYPAPTGCPPCPAWS